MWGEMMKISELIKLEPTDENIERLLYRGLICPDEKADVIMVLGSRKACDYRVPAAAELYFSGRAQRILLCGGKVQETSFGVMPEWESMYRAARQLGVPEEALLTERRSITTAENFTLAELVLKEHISGRRAYLVTTAYHMRRALLIGKKQLQGWDLLPCPVQKGSAAKENWYKTDKGRQTVLDEWGKFGYYIRVGLMDDEEI